MNISNFRLKLSAVASFTPGEPGMLDPQRLGLNEFSLDFPGVNIAHLIRLSVTNFGTGGNTITINANTLAVTLGAAAAATVTGGAGKDADGANINANSWRFVLMRIVSGDDETAILLGGGDFNLRAESGTPALASVLSPGLIGGAGTWTITGAPGVHNPPKVIEILAVGVSN